MANCNNYTGATGLQATPVKQQFVIDDVEVVYTSVQLWIERILKN